MLAGAMDDVEATNSKESLIVLGLLLVFISPGIFNWFHTGNTVALLNLVFPAALLIGSLFTWLRDKRLARIS